MDVHIDVLRRQVEEQRQHGVAVAREHIGIGPAHRADQQPVLHRAAIDEEILVIGHPAVPGRQARDAGQPHHPVGRVAFEFDGDRIVLQLMRDDPRHAGRQLLTGLQIEDGALGSIADGLERESNIGPRHREAADHVEAGGIFAAGRAQELAARGHLGEQLLDPHPRSRRQGGGLVRQQRAVIDHPPPAFSCAQFAAIDGQPCDAGDGGQRLAAKAERRHQLDCAVRPDQGIGQLRGRMAFERQCHGFGRHPAAVVHHLDPGKAAFGQHHPDSPRTRVDRVLDKLFERRSRAFDHLARGNAVHQSGREAADFGHLSHASCQRSQIRGEHPRNHQSHP